MDLVQEERDLSDEEDKWEDEVRSISSAFRVGEDWKGRDEGKGRERC